MGRLLPEKDLREPFDRPLEFDDWLYIQEKTSLSRLLGTESFSVSKFIKEIIFENENE